MCTCILCILNRWIIPMVGSRIEEIGISNFCSSDNTNDPKIYKNETGAHVFPLFTKSLEAMCGFGMTLKTSL
jgi:hypothetical protein